MRRTNFSQRRRPVDQARHSQLIIAARQTNGRLPVHRKVKGQVRP